MFLGGKTNISKYCGATVGNVSIFFPLYYFLRCNYMPCIMKKNYKLGKLILDALDIRNTE